MIKSIRYRCLLIIILICVACNNLNDSSIRLECPIITVNDINFNKEKDYSALFERIDLIPLETVENSLIGSISSVKKYRGNFYVFDRDISKAVFIFDKHGVFIKRICEIGKGPGEYIRPSYFSIDPYNDKLILCSISPYKILKYSLDGNLLEEIILDRGPRALEVINESKAIIKLTGQKDQISLINNDGTQIQGLLSINSGPSAVLFKDFIKYDNNVLFHQEYNDTIFLLSEEGKKPWLYIDFQDQKITKDIIDKIISEQLRLRRGVGPPENIMTGNYFYTESDNYVYFAFTAVTNGARKFFPSFYSKQTANFSVYHPDPGKYDQYSFLDQSIILDVSPNGQFIGHINSSAISESFSSINELVHSGFITIKGEKRILEPSTLNENSNPVIALFKLKDSF